MLDGEIPKVGSPILIASLTTNVVNFIMLDIAATHKLCFLEEGNRGAKRGHPIFCAHFQNPA
jgi:hypothetical protein